MNDPENPSALKGELKNLPVSSLSPCGWNPNEMNADTFNRLCKELDETDGGVGMIDPIQVIPMAPDETHAEPWFQIIGGEHRWRAASVLGWETIPCVVLNGENWKDQDLRKFVTLRLNALHGGLNAKKFAALYQDLAQRHSEEALQGLMAFTDNDAWTELVKGISKALEKSGVSKKNVKKFEKATKELGQVKDLSSIIGRMFQDHGEDLKQNFMILSFGGKDHLYIDCTAETFKAARAMASHCGESKVDINHVLAPLLEPWRERLDGILAARPKEAPLPDSEAPAPDVTDLAPDLEPEDDPAADPELAPPPKKRSKP